MKEEMKILVVGAGTMGRGIAQVAANSGISVTLTDISDDLLQAALIRINDSLESLVSRNKLSSKDKQALMNRISISSNLDQAASGAKLAIEAVTENLEVKKKIFQRIEEVCSNDCVLASNTSALSITDIASVLKFPNRMLGIHFFNPAPVMTLVELIRGVETSDETLEYARSIVESMQKVPVEAKEMPGFIVNRILVPAINEAAYLAMEGVATVEDIDTAMKRGANHPIGPLALGDLIGLDVCVDIMDTLHDEFQDSKYRTCPLLRKMVRAGLLGRKTKRGFYTY